MRKLEEYEDPEAVEAATRLLEEAIKLYNIPQAVMQPEQPNSPLPFTGEESVSELQEMILKYHRDNKHLRRANSRLKNTVRRRDKEIQRLKAENAPSNKKKKKVSNKSYKNGKRGSKFNG